MGTLQFKNNASTTLSGSINNSQTSVTVVNSGNFPVLTAGDYFYATMYELSGSTEINIEIIKVTGTSGNIWTIERGQDGTTSRSRDGITTCYVELRLTAASAQQMVQRDNNLSDLSNAATARTNLGLGSLATQSASSVAITGGTISGVTIAGIDSSTTIQDNVDSTKKVAFEVSGVATGVTRTLSVPNASGTIALTSDLTAGYQPLDSDLTAIAALAANGLIARTGTGTVAVRSITQPAAGITVTNGDGVSGNPTLALANDLAGVEALASTGFVRRTAADTWSASAIVDGDLPSALTGKTYNALTLTAAATGFSVAGGTTSKTLTVSNSLTLAGTDGTTITFPATSGTLPLNNQTFFLGTTSIAINRTTGAISLTGVSIDGSAGSATSATSATTATNLASGVLGSLPYQSAAATTALLAPNTTTTRNFLRMTGTGAAGAAPAWDTVTKTDVGLSNVENTAVSTWAGSTNITTLGTVATGTWNATAIGIAKGGTGQTTAVAAFDALSPATTLGDLIYHDGTDNVRLAGNTVAGRRFLRQTGNGTTSAAPAWDSLQDADVPSALTGKTYNALTLTAAATGFTIAGGTTSKTLTVSNTLTLAGTDASTLNIGAGGTLGSAAFTASTAYAPAAGSSSVVTVGTVTSGTWQGSAIGISYGGTGATSKAAGFNALSPVTTLGDLIYGDGANSNTRLAGNTTTSKRFLTQTGTGTVSAAPGWNAIVDGDLPSALTGKTYNGLTLTANATGFQVAGGTTSKTLAVSNNLTLSGTDGSTLNIGGGGTLGSAAYTASTAYQPIDADLTAIAALTGTSGFLKTNGAGTWSVDTATYLTGNQSITVSGDASGAGATAISLTLASVGTAGTYRSVTTDAKGRVTAGTNPTTLAGYGITDAQPLDADLTAIAALTGTSGFLKTNGAGTWSVDTATYLTGNQSITVSGDASGTGATAISLTLANSGVTAGTYNNVATEVRPFTVDAKGRVTGIGTAVTIAPAFSSITSKPTTISGYGITDAYTKTEVDSLVTGLDFKASVRVATTANITLSATQTIDGVAVIAGDRVLVKNQSTGSQNGIYVVAAGAWARSADANVSAEVTAGMYVFVEEGTANADSGWVLTTNAPITLDTTALTFTQFNGLGQITAGAGLTKTGNTLDVATASSARIVVNADSIDLATAGTAGTYRSVTTDAYGRVTAGTNPTTLSGYGITDAQPLDADLTAIAALTGTSGFLKTNGAGTWSVDTATYLTGNQSITLSGDATGSGSTAITVTLNTVPVGKGGTGATTLTGLVKGNGTSAFTAAVAGTDYVSPAGLTAFTGSSNIATVGTITNALYRHKPATNVNLFAEDGGGFYSDYTVQDDGTTYIARKIGGSTVTLQSGASDVLTASSSGVEILGTGRRIIGDFSNGTLASRLSFQTSTTNGTTAVTAIANGSGAASYYVAFAGSDPANAAYGWLSATTSGMDIYSDKTGTGSVQPIRLLTGGSVRFQVGTSGQLGVGGANYGTSGQVLTSQGSGAAPQWAAPSGGAWTPITTINASAASTVDFTGLTSTYDVYAIEVIKATGALSAASLQLRVSSNGGTSYDSGITDYRYVNNRGVNNAMTNSGSTASSVIIGSGLSAGVVSGWIYVFGPTDSGFATSVIAQTTDSATPATTMASGRREAAQADNAIRLLPNTGTVTGTFRLYGIKNS